MSKVIIGITGYAGSGKSTMAKYLVDNYGFERIPLAHSLKELVRDKFGVIHPKDFEYYYKEGISQPTHVNQSQVFELLLSELDSSLMKRVDNNPDLKETLYLVAIKISNAINNYLISDTDEERGKWARKVYQLIGTDFYRTIDENFWISRLIDRIENSKIDRVVIDDVRFPNEVHILKERYGDDFKLFCIKNNVNIDKVALTHESEKYVPELCMNSDIRIENNMVDEFFTLIDSVLKEEGIIHTLVNP